MALKIEFAEFYFSQTIVSIYLKIREQMGNYNVLVRYL